MKMRIAYFKTEGGAEMIGDDTWENYNGGAYIRRTEYIDADFPDRNPSEIVPEQVTKLEEARHRLRTEFIVHDEELKERISKLMAITQQ